MRYSKSTNCERGITLIELLIYVALLGVVSVFLANSMIQIVNAYSRARAEREVISNARLILETVSKNIFSASRVYYPTSRFNDDAGQLSLMVSENPPAEHETAYVDFWVDNGRFLTRKEGEGEIALSADAVRITAFRVEHILQGLGREAVKVTLKVEGAQVKFPTSATLNTTTAVRGNY